MDGTLFDPLTRASRPSSCGARATHAEKRRIGSCGRRSRPYRRRRRGRVENLEEDSRAVQKEFQPVDFESPSCGGVTEGEFDTYVAASAATSVGGIVLIFRPSIGDDHAPTR